jgi:hypothetical protein
LTTLVPASQLTACTKWQLQDIAPAQLLIEEQPGQVLVTRTDGKWLHLDSPRVVNDSLVGIDHYLGPPTRGVPLSQVQYVQVKKTDWLMTGLVIGLPVSLVVAIAASGPQC